MKLYLDDDSSARLLVRLLHAAGHGPVTTADAGMRGRPDPIHLGYAIKKQRTLLTANHDDFRMLHELIMLADRHHPGILVVCKENDRRRDMSPRAIVLAIARLCAAGFDLRDQFQILNHWR